MTLGDAAQVPRLFADIMEACKQLARPGEEAAAAELWLRCMPLEGEVRDFFRPSVEAVHRTVAGMPCVLVEGGRWVQPCEALLATNVAMRELMQEQGILQEQGLSVVHPDLHPFAPALKVLPSLSPAATACPLLGAQVAHLHCWHAGDWGQGAWLGASAQPA